MVEDVKLSCEDVSSLQGYLARRWLRRLNQYDVLRGRLALGIGVCVLTIFGAQWYSRFAEISLWLGSVALLVLLIAVSVVARQSRVLRSALDVCQRDEAARRLYWPDLPVPKPQCEEKHSYASHLHVAGPQSLIHLLDISGTPDGTDRLREWLLHPNLEGTAHAQRRALVRCFEVHRTLRIRFRLARISSIAALADLGRHSDIPEPNLQKWFVVYMIAWAGILTAIALGYVWFVVVAAVAYLAWFVWIFDQSTLAEDPSLSAVSAIRDIERLAKKVSSRAPGPIAARLNTLMHPTTGIPSFQRQLMALSWLEWVRTRPLLAVFLNALIPFDVLIRILQMRARGILIDHAPRWSLAWGELEAAVSLAALSDRASFIEAKVSTSDVLSFKAFGHPLLNDCQDVRNDLAFSPDASVVCLTGANMSGKSTILRSIGLNLILFQAGGRVKASSAELPLLPVFASVDVVDDLNAGASRFASEVVQIAQLTRYAFSQGSAIFLIDEIFSTTNNRERKIATVELIEQLITSGSMGVVTTHDAGVVEGIRTVDGVHLYHMGLDTRNDDLISTYRMHYGQAPSGNALYLMRRAGVLQQRPT